MDKELKRLYTYMLSKCQPRHCVVKTESTVMIGALPAYAFTLGSTTSSSTLDAAKTIKYPGVAVYTKRAGEDHVFPPCKLFPQRISLK